MRLHTDALSVCQYLSVNGGGITLPAWAATASSAEEQVLPDGNLCVGRRLDLLGVRTDPGGDELALPDAV